jgi:hypothetical protein
VLVCTDNFIVVCGLVGRVPNYRSRGLGFYSQGYKISHGLVGRVPNYRSRGPGFYSQGYKISQEVVGLDWGQLSLMRITQELLECKSSSSGYRRPRSTTVGDTLCLQKLAVTSPTSGQFSWPEELSIL